MRISSMVQLTDEEVKLIGTVAIDQGHANDSIGLMDIIVSRSGKILRVYDVEQAAKEFWARYKLTMQ